MKDIIQLLMTELSVLTTPYNPVDLKKIFDRRSISDTTQTPHLKSHLEQLSALGKLVDKSFSLELQLHNLTIQKKNLDGLIDKDKLNQKRIAELQGQALKSSMFLNSSFEELLPMINQFSQKHNLSTVVYDKTMDTQKKINAVEQYYKKLTQISTEFDAPSAKLKLLLLKGRIYGFITELNTLGVICSADHGIDRFNKLSTTVSASINQLKEVQPKLIALHTKFAQQLSENDVNLKLQEIEKLLVAAVEQLQIIQLHISINTLEIKVKDRLVEEYKNALNKTELIRKYQNKIATAISYADPIAWHDWWQNSTKYQEDQIEFKISVDYLELLQKEAIMQLRIGQYIKQKNALTDLPKGTQSLPDNSVDLNILVSLAKSLFAEYPILTKPNSTASGSDFFLALLANIPIIELKIEQRNHALIKLKELASADAELDQLRTQFEFWADNDSKLPSEAELRKQIADQQTQNSQREALNQNLDSCKSYLENAKAFQQLIKQRIDALAIQKDIQSCLEVANKAAPKPSQMELITEQLSSLQNEITKSIAQIKLLPLPNTIPEPSVTELNETPIPSSDLPVVDPPDISNSLISSITNQSSNHIFAPKPIATVVAFHPILLNQPVLKPQDDSTPIPDTTESIQDKLTASFVQMNQDIELLRAQTPPKDDESPLKCVIATTNILPNLNSSILMPAEYVLNNRIINNYSGLDVHTAPDLKVPPVEQKPVIPMINSDFIILAPIQIEPAIEPIIIPLEIPAHQVATLELLPDTQTVTNEQHQHSVELPLIALDTPVQTDSSFMDHVEDKSYTSLQIVPYAPNSLIEPPPSFINNLVPKAIDPSADIKTVPEQADANAQSEPNLLMTPPAEVPLIPSKLSLPAKRFDPQMGLNWHQQIQRSLLKQPEDVQQWYQNVYIACREYLKAHPSSYTPYYLLRDICFELKQKTDLNVIRAYMRQCQTPATDIDNLLSLKPDLPLVYETFNVLSDLQNVPPELQPLYAHYIELRKLYPVESELLLQAIQAVRMAKIISAMPNDNIQAQIPLLSDDPRFDLLKRHRGFLKMWEAIEDLCRLLIGTVIGQHEYEYTKRPCFFKTKSAQLLEDADLIIQADLQEVRNNTMPQM